jgi:hypothetical protein
MSCVTRSHTAACVLAINATRVESMQLSSATGARIRSGRHDGIQPHVCLQSMQLGLTYCNLIVPLARVVVSCAEPSG